jgi:hypothetical protein
MMQRRNLRRSSKRPVVQQTESLELDAFRAVGEPTSSASQSIQQLPCGMHSRPKSGIASCSAAARKPHSDKPNRGFAMG